MIVSVGLPISDAARTLAIIVFTTTVFPFPRKSIHMGICIGEGKGQPPVLLIQVRRNAPRRDGRRVEADMTSGPQPASQRPRADERCRARLPALDARSRYRAEPRTQADCSMPGLLPNPGPPWVAGNYPLATASDHGAGTDEPASTASR